MRYFGVEGLRDRMRNQLSLASEFANWVDQSEHFERLASVPFSLVCFRAHPSYFKKNPPGGPEENPQSPHCIDSALDRLNERLLDEVNRRGKVFLSHTKLKGRFTLRLAIGNIRTTHDHVKLAWDELNEVLARMTGHI